MSLFEKIFIKGEKQEFKRIGLFVCITLIVSFIGLGFSTGIKKNLDEKMNDPFINTLEKSLIDKDLVTRHSIFANIQNDSVYQSELHIKDIAMLGSFNLQIRSKDSLVGSYYSIYYSHEFLLLDKILNSKTDKNLIAGTPKINSDEYGLIVTEKLLKQLGYKDLSQYPEFLQVQYRLAEKNTVKYVYYNIPITSIVTHLPGESAYSNTQCYVSNYFAGNFYESLITSNHTNRLNYVRFDPRLETDFTLFVPGSINTSGKEIAKTLKNILEKNSSFVDSEFEIVGEKIDSLYTYKGKGSVIKLLMEKPSSDPFSPPIYPSYLDCISLYEILQADTTFKRMFSEVVLIKNRDLMLNSSYLDHRISGNVISVTFNNLDEIEQIYDQFKNKYGVEFEMSKFENKRNYQKVSALSVTSNIIIMIISCIAVTLTTVFLLINYLEKVKTSIGTLMAFGVKGIKGIYLKIIYLYLGVAWVIATIFVSLVQLGFWLNNPNELLIYLWSPYYLILMVIIALLPLIIFRFLNKTLFEKTPGDLIYDR